MTQLPMVALGAFLDALDGIAYVVSPEGVILASGTTNWLAFAQANRADLPPDAVVGRSLFDIIVGEDVRAAYRDLHDKALRTGLQLSFQYRCDAPGVERRMKMTLGPLRGDAGMVGVLYQSVILSETARIPLHFLSAEEVVTSFKVDHARPVVRVCAWCADVQSPGRAEWIPPQDYYRQGGSDWVQLSHGICPTCRDGVLDPLLRN